MRLRRGLALALLVSCAHPPTAMDAVPDGAAAADPVPDAAASIPGPFADEPDAGPSIDLSSDGGFAALLSGAVPAARLPEVATDRSFDLDRSLRERLTTESAGSDSFGSSGAAGAVTINAVAATPAIADADRVVASTRPRARQCYNVGLRDDPTMTGKLVVTAKVDATGEVSNARVASNTGLSTPVASCVARIYQNVIFTAPAGGVSATATITLTFASQK